SKRVLSSFLAFEYPCSNLSLPFWLISTIRFLSNSKKLALKSSALNSSSFSGSIVAIVSSGALYAVSSTSANVDFNFSYDIIVFWLKVHLVILFLLCIARSQYLKCGLYHLMMLFSFSLFFRELSIKRIFSRRLVSIAL